MGVIQVSPSKETATGKRMIYMEATHPNIETVQLHDSCRIPKNGIAIRETKAPKCESASVKAVVASWGRAVWFGLGRTPTMPRKC
eukprot:5672761-Amphidinium_carterae.2